MKSTPTPNLTRYAWLSIAAAILTIALKLGEYDFLKQHTGTMPLLLIDDLFDKLDEHRVQRIIQLVSGEAFGQIFITDTHARHLDQLLQLLGGDYRFFQVTNGMIQNQLP